MKSPLVAGDTVEAAAGPPAPTSYQAICDVIDDVVFSVGTDGRWAYLSPAWERWSGWSPAACHGRRVGGFLHADDRGVAMQAWRDLGSGRRQTFRGQVRIRTAGGGSRWMLASARWVQERAGMPGPVVGTLTDVSAFKTVEAGLEAARKSAEGESRAKSELLSSLSHDLRTPLNAVIGLSESMLEEAGAGPSERNRRYLGVIRDSGRQLLAEVDDLIDLARLEARTLQPTLGPIDLAVVARLALDAVQGAIRARGLQGRLLQPANRLWANADERLLSRVVQVLVKDAIKVSPVGGDIEVCLDRTDGGEATIRVSAARGQERGADAAGGQRPPAAMSGPRSKSGGSVLGLALADRILRLHGGRLTTRSGAGWVVEHVLELPGVTPAAGPDDVLSPAGAAYRTRVYT